MLDDTVITSADVVPAAEDLPAYCRVRASVRPTISIEVRLPQESWNGKLYQVGCGAGCGMLGRSDAQGSFINAMNPGLRRGYATATSDGGHHSLDIFDSSWALDNPAAERDWAWRALGETYRVAHALATARYDSAPERSYFQGCSTGGRLAHTAAIRYPEHFDGIISGAPVLDQAGLAGVFGAWIIQANSDADGEPILSPDKNMLVADEVMRQCDVLDGTEDRLIADPRACSAELTTLACADGGASADCLSEAELEVIEKWRQGPRDSAGEVLYPGGIPEGSERFWWLWLTGNGEGAGRLFPRVAEGYLRYMGFVDDPGPRYSPLAFDFDEDVPRLAEKGVEFAADSVALEPFRDAGGRMLVWHGWADAIVTPYRTVLWHDELIDRMGGKSATDAFVRLFMIPGMDHCGVLDGEGGLNQFSIDPLGALESWVERDEAPESIMR